MRHATLQTTRPNVRHRTSIFTDSHLITSHPPATILRASPRCIGHKRDLCSRPIPCASALPHEPRAQPSKSIRTVSPILREPHKSRRLMTYMPRSIWLNGRRLRRHTAERVVILLLLLLLLLWLWCLELRLLLPTILHQGVQGSLLLLLRWCHVVKAQDRRFVHLPTLLRLRVDFVVLPRLLLRRL